MLYYRMSYEELHRYVSRGLSQREMAKLLDCSQGRVKYWLKKYGLITKYSRKNEAYSKQYSINRVGYLGKRALLVCVEHGQQEFYLESNKRYRCKKCNSESILRRKKKLKVELIRKFGGVCTRCGYSQNINALEFHHIDKMNKSFNLAQMTSHSRDKVIQEANKCVLLCANCHRELESEGL